MHVAIVTVGDELLAGSTTNTNASWLASRITERGSSVERVLTIPDDRALIADTVSEWHETFDAVIVTGGIGGTPDDVSVEGVADGLDRDLIVHEGIREGLLEKAAAFRDENPELLDEYDLEIDLDATAAIPAGATPIVTDESWAPGCVAENVYVFAGIPDEMRAMFDRVADEFRGDAVTRTIYTPAPEGSLHTALEGVTDAFDVSVGSYPRSERRPGRIRVRGTDVDAVADAIAWLEERVETTEPPETSQR
ncbi:competence/damage-inducible protein A [Natronolimnohabitans innermongolicus]|uniref:Molybdopterin binding domain-containing protein n=1 Tax=Natronolimnohabitans innermongolicus JCM 12255 TaxID=1227499 RepID=L9X6K9_9EURY|nr:molybdopterin-binding protein [Natronolimnohabitans innermongolicus]ELY57429.1 molybdopterin binding domain-containing protein [Natronolimnohabitans innermongolicus JCM 12255]